MAEGKNDLSLGDDKPIKGGSKKKIIIIIVAVILLLGAGVGGYFFFSDDSDEQLAEQIVEDEYNNGTISQKGPAIYVAMPLPFVFNVTDGKRERLVQIEVQLMVRGEGNAALARKHSPLLEGTLVRVFGAATIDQLRSPAGKAQLRVFSLKALNDAMTKVENKALIYSVLFTGFVLQ